MSHSPLPWAERELPETLKPDGYRRIVDKDGRHVATVPYSTPTIPGTSIDGHANLEYLLQAANAHDDLLEQLCGIADTLATGETATIQPNSAWAKRIFDAIAKGERRQSPIQPQ